MKLAIALMAGTFTLGIATAASAADHCRFFADPQQEGANKTYNLPAVADNGGTAWYAASSIRRTGSSLDADTAVYNNAESVRIVAEDSAVHLYAFDGDNFDGDVDVLRCAKGRTCEWTLGWSKNKTSSFFCQREHNVDFGIPGAGVADDLIVPTSPIGNELATQVDQKLEASDQVEDSATRYGRMRWSTAWKRCENHGLCGPDSAVLKHHDEIQFTYKSQLDPNWSAREYHVWIDFWLRPRVTGDHDPLVISESYWRVSVEDNGHLQDDIRDAVANKIRGMFDTVGDKVTTFIRTSIRQVVERLGGDNSHFNRAINNNVRIVLTYNCTGARMNEIWVRNLGATLTDADKIDPCGRRVNSDLLSPHIALVKDVNR
jgi:hypothetical protein